MNISLDRPWTTDMFLAWEDRQEGKYEFDGRNVIPMTGGSVAHQEIVFNLLALLRQRLTGRPFWSSHAMRLRIDTHVRYPDVVVCAGPLDQTTRILTDAVAIFEVLSNETATTDRVTKFIDYAAVPSLRCFVLLEQTTMAATIFQREAGGVWIASAHTDGALVLPLSNVTIPLAGLYRRLTFPAQTRDTA